MGSRNVYTPKSCQKACRMTGEVDLSYKCPAMWKHIFLANKQVSQLGGSVGSIARYVTGAAALLSVLEIESENYVFM